MRSAVKAVNYRPTRGQAYRGRGVRRERLSGAKVSNSQYVRGIARTPEDQLGGARNGLHGTTMAVYCAQSWRDGVLSEMYCPFV